ncbi:hypothetical protein BDD12DRAFT_873013 [Trichophaea hybrida]|nr:hypothetical protein BDD12DRAFT_873013 [Trichophaea hybrida]
MHIDDSDIDIIYIPTVINPNKSAIPIVIQPDPDKDFEDPLQSIRPIPHHVINLIDNKEGNKLAQGTAPIDDDELELLLTTNIATSSTPDMAPVQQVDLNFKVENIESKK